MGPSPSPGPKEWRDTTGKVKCKQTADCFHSLIKPQNAHSRKINFYIEKLWLPLIEFIDSENLWNDEVKQQVFLCTIRILNQKNRIRNDPSWTYSLDEPRMMILDSAIGKKHATNFPIVQGEMHFLPLNRVFRPQIPKIISKNFQKGGAIF